jgi:hypothetical protein
MCRVNVDWTGSGYDQEATACEDKNHTLLGYYVALSGNFLPTFRDKLSFPSSMIKMGPTGSSRDPTGCHETSVRNYHYSLRNGPE